MGVVVPEGRGGGPVGTARAPGWVQWAAARRCSTTPRPNLRGGCIYKQVSGGKAADHNAAHSRLHLVPEGELQQHSLFSTMTNTVIRPSVPYAPMLADLGRVYGVSFFTRSTGFCTDLRRDDGVPGPGEACVRGSLHEMASAWRHGTCYRTHISGFHAGGRGGCGWLFGVRINTRAVRLCVWGPKLPLVR
jgi:hypothetical protein